MDAKQKIENLVMSGDEAKIATQIRMFSKAEHQERVITMMYDSFAHEAMRQGLTDDRNNFHSFAINILIGLREKIGSYGEKIYPLSEKQINIIAKDIAGIARKLVK